MLGACVAPLDCLTADQLTTLSGGLAAAVSGVFVDARNISRRYLRLSTTYYEKAEQMPGKIQSVK